MTALVIMVVLQSHSRHWARAVAITRSPTRDLLDSDRKGRAGATEATFLTQEPAASPPKVYPPERRHSAHE